MSELVADTAVVSVWATIATETGRASVANGMVLCGSCATDSVRTIPIPGAGGSTDTLDLLVRELATRGLSGPVPATGGSSDPCLDACAQGCLTLALQILPLV